MLSNNYKLKHDQKNLTRFQIKYRCGTGSNNIISLDMQIQACYLIIKTCEIIAELQRHLS